MTSNNLSRWRYAACLTLFVVTTVYVSLYPWRPGRAISAPTPWAVLASATWFRHGLRFTSDMVLNVLFYLPFGVFGMWTLPPSAPSLGRIIPVVLAGGLLSLGVEVAQFNYHRVTSPVDVLTNTLGVFVGTLLALILQANAGWQHKVGPALLLACLAVHGVLAYRVGTSLSTGPYWVLWAAAAWMLLGFFRVRAFARPLATAAFLVLVLTALYEELRPFNPAGPIAPFEWRPFIASIDASGLGSGAVFSRKLFHYGSMLLAAIYARIPPLVAAATLASLLLGLEHIQRILPGRTPESTDAVIVLFWAIILRLVLPPRAIV